MWINKKMEILIVDDDCPTADLIKEYLSDLGFANIDVTTNGESALSRMKDKHYGLIISDWAMEPISGIELLKTMRSRGNGTPFIMVTGDNRMTSLSDANDEGVNNYIVKPIEKNILKETLIKIFGRFE